MGVVPSVDALARTMLGFRVVTPKGEPVPGAAVYVAIPEVGTLKVGYADVSGRILLGFSPELLRRDPVVFGEKGGQLYGVEFSITWGGKLGESPAPWERLRNLQLRTVGHDGLWYEEGLPEEWVRFGTWVLEKGRRFLREFLGWEPPSFGLLLSLQPTLPMIPGGKLQIHDREVLVFPFSVQRESPREVFTTGLHEWAEAALHERFGAQRLPRWVVEGIAEYAAYAPLRRPPVWWRRDTVLREVQQQACEYMAEALERARQYSRENPDVTQRFNLLQWRYAGPAYPLREELHAWGYPAAGSAVDELCRRFGESFPRRFLEELSRSADIAAEAVLRTLHHLTGMDWQQRLQGYPDSAVLRTLERVKAEICAARKH